MKKIILGLTIVVSAANVSNAIARDTISIVGSSTVYPFSTVVAERFGKTTDFKSPKVEATGSGGGLKLFCNGLGTQTPDIANASRRIKESEFDQCQANGVKDIIEVKVGFDGIVLANSKQAAPMTLGKSSPTSRVRTGRCKHDSHLSRRRRKRCPTGFGCGFRRGGRRLSRTR